MDSHQLLQQALTHHRAGELNDAATLYQQVLGQEPENPDALHGYGVLSMQTGNVDRAERLLAPLFDAHPHVYRVAIAKGNLRASQMRWQDSADAFSEAIDLDAAPYPAYEGLAGALERLERFDEASAQYAHASRARNADIQVVKTSTDVNVYHCCVQKTASQWFRALFNDPAFYRNTGLTPYPYVRLGLREAGRIAALPERTIGTHFYVDYGTYAAIPKPAKYSTLYVLRDPRDIVVSWYYSARYSHSDVYPMGEIRQALQPLSEEDGYQYIIDRLRSFGLFAAQRSWVEKGGADALVKFFRYEDLVNDERDFIRELLKFVGVVIPENRLDQLQARIGFRTLSGGRSHGQEKHDSHYRKGAAGDWRDKMSNAVADHFYRVTGDLVSQLGYE